MKIHKSNNYYSEEPRNSSIPQMNFNSIHTSSSSSNSKARNLNEHYFTTYDNSSKSSAICNNNSNLCHSLQFHLNEQSFKKFNSTNHATTSTTTATNKIHNNNNNNNYSDRASLKCKCKN